MEDKRMNIIKILDEGKLSISLEGRLDTTTAPELEKALDGSLDGVSELTIDMGGCAFFWAPRRR